MTRCPICRKREGTITMRNDWGKMIWVCRECYDKMRE